MRTSSLASLLFLFCMIPALAIAQSYTVTDLGALAPAAINTWGQVVGEYNGKAALSTWTNHGTRHTQILGLLSGGTFSSAATLNDLGVVAGVADGPGTITWPDATTESCTDLVQPFLWAQATGMRGLGAPAVAPDPAFLPQCGLYTYANAINDRGQIVGSNRDFATYKFGFVWTRRNGVSQFRDAFQTAANGINNVGQIAGQTSIERLADVSHAALWKNAMMTDLGTLGGDSSDWFFCSGAESVSDVGQVVGWSQLANASNPCFLDSSLSFVHAFLWKAGTAMEDLGTLSGDTSSVAQKINFFGQIIGSSGNTVVWKDGVSGERIQVLGRPFIWSMNSGMQDLNTLIPASSGWVLNSVTDINIWGQIVGEGTLNGQPHGFLLTP